MQKFVQYFVDGLYRKYVHHLVSFASYGTLWANFKLCFGGVKYSIKILSWFGGKNGHAVRNMNIIPVPGVVKFKTFIFYFC